MPKLGLLIMDTAKSYSRSYVTFVRVVVAQDRRHLLTIAKTVMKLTKDKRKIASTQDENKKKSHSRKNML